ncbi:MAG: PKD domain-containing protein, partial [Cyanothece sp. SIO2G6]|nr:PKD domain-containing protein [Cyanothece sp. SIO2G6]
FAVPTLFNGNFDAISANLGNRQSIPGWSSNYNVGRVLDQSSLVNLTKISSLSTSYQIGWEETPDPTRNRDGKPIFGTYLDQLGLTPNDPNYKDYALRLNNGEAITHNHFVVPDWGVLRLDLHAPNMGGLVEITIEDATNSGNSVTQTIKLEEANGPHTNGYNDDDTYRIGYGSVGFETFHIEVPETLRGQVATVTLEAQGNTVYLDDIFFKSENLLLGNPTDARTTLPADPRNFLVERPQYALSYNLDTKTPNWVSWQLNNRWTGAALRPGDPANPIPPDTNRNIYPWQVDGDLSRTSGIKSPQPTDYLGAASKTINAGNVVQPERGHIVAVADRDRHVKDLMATFFTSNIFAQDRGINRGQWSTFETYLQDKLVDQEHKELYIISGGYGFNTEHTKRNGNPTGIKIPDHIWKVVAVLEKDQGIADVTAATPLIVIDMPNDEEAVGRSWHDISNGYRITLGELERRINTNGGNISFFSHLSNEIQKDLKDKPVDNLPFPAVTANLLAVLGENPALSVPQLSSQAQSFTIGKFGVTEVTLSQPGITNNGSAQLYFFEEGFTNQIRFPEITLKDSVGQVSAAQIGLIESTSFKDSISKASTTEIAVIESSAIKSDIFNNSSTQVGPVENRVIQFGPTQIDVSQTSLSEVRRNKDGITQLSTTEIGFSEHNFVQLNASQINASQVKPGEIQVSVSNIVPIQELFTVHNTPLQNTRKMPWANFLQGSTLFNLNIEIRDLPTGQLAEATITRFDTNGQPIAGTILLDDDANGLGWYIDPTPWDNTEYHPDQTDTLLKATPDSPAHGRYDLLTTLLHELGHLAGIIHGNPTYDDRLQYLNGTPTFIGNGYTAELTHDLSHLADPTQLMSPYLAPGIRKLPSPLELQILADLRSTLSDRLPTSTPISAAHGAQPLVGITNGDFEQLLDHWNQRGGIQPTQTGSSTAITLTEDSPILSQLSQTFIIPDDPDQRFLTFDLLETDLNHSTHRPPDAFEIALLDAHSHTPLVGTLQDHHPSLTHTDALLNLQANGTLTTDDNVTITPLDNGHRRVKIDLSDVAPGAIATFTFDLLGFGTPDSHITLDNITLGNDNTPPVATDDTATLSQGDTLALDLLSNDLDPDQPLTSNNIHTTTQPLHGTLSRNSDGTLIYRPHDGYVGSDHFTYTLRDSDGERSAPATVHLDITNRAPQIETLSLPDAPIEGKALSFRATATDPGNDSLTYTWTFGDGSAPVVGPNATHTYADNGHYTVTLTVNDEDGGRTTEARSINVHPDQAVGFQFTHPCLNEASDISPDSCDQNPAQDMLLEHILIDGDARSDLILVNQAVIVQNDKFTGGDTGGLSADKGDEATIGVAAEDVTAEQIANALPTQQSVLTNYNLNSIVDTEDKGAFTIDLFFEKAVDNVLVWERGMNSALTLQALDSDGNRFGNVVNLGNRAGRTLKGFIDWYDAGFAIDTLEIDETQPVGSIGLSKTDLGVAEDVRISGVRLISAGRKYNGPDWKVMGTLDPRYGAGILPEGIPNPLQ